MSRLISAIVLLFAFVVFHPSSASAAAACEDLAKLSLPNTSITLAQNIGAGAFTGQWKQTGKAPEELTFDHYKNGMSVGKRLVCQYPKVPTYKGSGNTEDPTSFVQMMVGAVEDRHNPDFGIVGGHRLLRHRQ